MWVEAFMANHANVVSKIRLQIYLNCLDGFLYSAYFNVYAQRFDVIVRKILRTKLALCILLFVLIDWPFDWTHMIDRQTNLADQNTLHGQPHPCTYQHCILLYST